MPHDSVLIETGLQVLKRYAAEGETLSYDEMNRELGEPFESDADLPGRIGELCDDINAHHSKATGLKLMISVLVRNGETGLPDDGFFKLAAGLGRLAWTDDLDAKRAFVGAQERRVFMVYRQPKPSVGAGAPVGMAR
ncbi:hypothetical protein K3N28_18380 [Glycomyces sp. TRM65418]|uniref:hypothetical protein n=1 Tax=Glycomyces sp. TRM65418 TaxID=2867006 RepID=UPI001CE4BC17|nr:hypothetical protein [Glycomyces sp. TRM65418]MCC3765030.1 hypothetical protein [Glycomyces sp. TRM65418]QZD54659.1 hypothetical protein K3N28_18290 [Glycomyces sp. TRM65418]